MTSIADLKGTDLITPEIRDLVSLKNTSPARSVAAFRKALLEFLFRGDKPDASFYLGSI